MRIPVTPRASLTFGSYLLMVSHLPDSRRKVSRQAAKVVYWCDAPSARLLVIGRRRLRAAAMRATLAGFASRPTSGADLAPLRSTASYLAVRRDVGHLARTRTRYRRSATRRRNAVRRGTGFRNAAPPSFRPVTVPGRAASSQLLSHRSRSDEQRSVSCPVVRLRTTP